MKFASSSKDLLVVRAHAIDDALIRLIHRSRSVANICVVLDVSAGIPSDVELESLCNNVGVVFLRKEDLSSLQIHCPSNAFWRCGDYALYRALLTYPDANRYWLIEPDVYINCENLDDFLREMPKDCDFIASRFGLANSSWVWYNSIKPFCAEPHQCLFSFCGFSNCLANYLLHRRIAVSKQFTKEYNSELWPNDEVFCATEAAAGGFICSDLNTSSLKRYSRDTFRLTPPISEAKLRGMPLDNLIYHPAVAKHDFYEKVTRRLKEARNRGSSKNDVLTIFNEDVLKDLEIECGNSVLERFKTYIFTYPEIMADASTHQSP